MSIHVVVGTNWGDEGKGRMVDYLAQNADVVVRYQGGNNAGHTVSNELGKFALHLIPSGVFNPAATNVLGPGMVINFEALLGEISALRDSGVPARNIKISERATICFPFYQYEDVWEEERLGKHAYGSTKSGIAPAYGDRYKKRAIQVGDIFHKKKLEERLRRIIDFKNLIAEKVYGRASGISYDEMLDWVYTHGDQIRDMVCDTTELLENAVSEGKNILLEAQLGALRDIHYGIYPFTTSSCTLSAFAPIGSGLLGLVPDSVIGVMKAFSTCVGAGPFVTEIDDEVSDALRKTAGEYGATTGRPRRIGFFDAVASRYGAKMQNVSEIALTKLDCLSGLDPVPVCTHYDYKGKQLEKFPLNAVLEDCRPVYQDMKGWKEDISGVRDYKDLPPAAREYVLEIERLIERPIRYISVGPDRESLMIRDRR